MRCIFPDTVSFFYGLLRISTYFYAFLRTFRTFYGLLFVLSFCTLPY